MNIEKIEYKRAGETVYSWIHPSGLKVFIIPKPGYSKKHAAYSTHYGSVNNRFIVPGEARETIVPDGIAHFLEHKLFEQEDGSVMDKFANLGSNPNAYTGFCQTVYIFSCTDRFDENLRLLVDFVQNPYITQESVEKEKGIIGQEIMMYQDNAGWRSFFNLLRAFYRNNPVKIDIAGTAESISKIDRDILYKCYNTFYHPSNMSLLVVGDVNPEEVFEMLGKAVKVKALQPEIKRNFPDEPAGSDKSYIEQTLAVSMPQFQMGYKDNGFMSRGLECLKREVAIKLVLAVMMGRSSPLYNELYSEGLINTSFDFDYTIEESFAFSMFGGESKDPVKVRERVLEAVARMKKSGVAAGEFERLRKSMLGKFLKQFNSIERISHSFISIYFKGVNIFDYLDVYDKITIKYANQVLHQHFDEGAFALSVIKPSGKA